ncbi:MAG: hypothetical protein ACI9XO_004717 [Paraglaciecola sp.]
MSLPRTIEHLDAGKIVVLDISATWCPPCWTFHQGHYLQDLHDAYGPDGTGQVRVMFYEGDRGTNADDLNGTGSNTMGDWIGDSTYPIMNESAPLSLDLSIYAPLGFPTVGIIRPSDYEITHDVYNATSLSTIKDAINTVITLDNPNNPSNVSEAIQTAALIDLFPNPVTASLTIDLSAIDKNVDQATIVNILGKVVAVQAVNTATTFNVNVADLASGIYFVNLSANGKTVASKKFNKN